MGTRHKKTFSLEFTIIKSLALSDYLKRKVLRIPCSFENLQALALAISAFITFIRAARTFQSSDAHLCSLLFPILLDFSVCPNFLSATPFPRSSVFSFWTSGQI